MCIAHTCLLLLQLIRQRVHSQLGTPPELGPRAASVQFSPRDRPAVGGALAAGFGAMYESGVAGREATAGGAAVPWPSPSGTSHGLLTSSRSTCPGIARHVAEPGLNSIAESWCALNTERQLIGARGSPCALSARPVCFSVSDSPPPPFF